MELLKKYNKSESLLKHALSVEAVMRYMAKSMVRMRRNGEL